MMQARKKFVVAAEHRHARHFAESMDWKRAEWEFVSKPDKLKGLYGIVVYDVRIPRMKLTGVQKTEVDVMHMAIQEGLASGRIARHNVVNLP